MEQYACLLILQHHMHWVFRSLLSLTSEDYGFGRIDNKGLMTLVPKPLSKGETTRVGQNHDSQGTSGDQDYVTERQTVISGKTSAQSSQRGEYHRSEQYCCSAQYAMD